MFSHSSASMCVKEKQRYTIDRKKERRREVKAEKERNEVTGERGFRKEP